MKHGFHFEDTFVQKYTLNFITLLLKTKKIHKKHINILKIHLF